MADQKYLHSQLESDPNAPDPCISHSANTANHSNTIHNSEHVSDENQDKILKPRNAQNDIGIHCFALGMETDSKTPTSESAEADKHSTHSISPSQEGVYEQENAHPGSGAAGYPRPQEDDCCNNNESKQTGFLNNPSNQDRTPLHPHSVLTPLHRVGYVVFTSPTDSNLSREAAHNHSRRNPHEGESSLQTPPVINFANPYQVNNFSPVPIFTISPGSEASSSNHMNVNTNANATDFLNSNHKADIKVPVPQYQQVLFPSPIMIPQQWNSNTTVAHPPFSFSIPNSIHGNSNAPSPIPVAYLFSTLAEPGVNNSTNKHQNRDNDTEEGNSSDSEEEDENVCDCVDCRSLKIKQNESDSHSDVYSSCSEYNYYTDTDESEEEKMMYDCQSASHCCLHTLHEYEINSDKEEEENQYQPDRTSKISKNDNGRQRQRKRPLEKSDRIRGDEATYSKRGKQTVAIAPTPENADNNKHNNFSAETCQNCQSQNRELREQENCTSDLLGQVRSNLAKLTHQEQSERDMDMDDVDESEADRKVHKNNKDMDEDEFEGESEKGDNNESDTEDDDEADADDEKDTEEDKNNCGGNCEKNINVVIVVKVKNASDPEQVFSNDDNGQENRRRISRQVSDISKVIAKASPSSSSSMSKLTFSSQITSQNVDHITSANKVTILESSVANKESHLNVSPKPSASTLSPQIQCEVVSDAMEGTCLVPTPASDDPLLQAIRHALGVQDDDDEEDFEEEYEPIDEDEDNDNENEEDEEDGETEGLFAFANTEDYRGRLALVENLVLSYGKISSLNEKLNVSLVGDVSHVVIGGFLVSASYITRESRKAGYSLGFYLDDLDQNSFLLQIQDGILRVGGRRDQTDLALRIEIGAPVRIEDINVVHNKATNVIWVEVFF